MDFTKAPKASDVVQAIELLIFKHGDMPLCADDPDTSWRMRIGIVFKPENPKENWPARFEIKTSYSGKPPGLIGVDYEDD
jgi:hypothetical protein